MKTTVPDKGWLEKTFRRIMLGFALPDPKALEILRRHSPGGGATGISQAHYNQVGADEAAFVKKMERCLDPQIRVRALKRLGIQVLYHHAKNHTGVACYATKVGHRFSPMGDRDFFGELVKACRAAGIVPGAMYQVGMDELAAAQHPDWLQMDATGKTSRFRLCFNHPEWRARVLAQAREIAAYDLGAFMYDELSFGWDNMGMACSCPHCRAAFREAAGEEMPAAEDWENPLWLRFLRWRSESIRGFLQETRAAIREVNPAVALTGIFYASPRGSCRSGWSSESAASALDYVIVDSSGVGNLGQMSRYFRALSRGRPELAVGPAFLLKTPGYSYTDNELPTTPVMFMADAMTVLANGVTPGFESHGWYDRRFWDRRRATMTSPSFDRLYRQVSREIRRREPWLGDAEPVRNAAVLYSENSRDLYGRSDPERYAQCYFGWCKALLDRQQLFEVVTDRHVHPEELARYALLVLPNAACLSDGQAEAVRAYVREGGGLVASYLTSLCDENGKAREDFALADVFGASYAGGREEDFNVQGVNPARRDQYFMHFEEPHRLLVGAVGPGEVFTLPAPTVFTRTNGSGQGIGRFHVRRKDGVKYEGRSDGVSGQGRDEATEAPVLVTNGFGKGRVVYFPGRMASSYGVHGHPVLHRIILNAVRWVAARRSPVEVKAPKCVEVTAFHQPSRQRLVVHLVNYQSIPYRAHLNNNMPFGGAPPVEEILPVHDLEVEVALAGGGRPSLVYEAPSKAKLKWEMRGRGRLHIRLPRLEIHSMVVAEFGGVPSRRRR